MDKNETIIETLAATFHENRREGRLMDNWRYRPMVEKSNDDEWNAEHWTDVVDIANTKFEDLPSNWKYENLEAAKVAVELVYEKVTSGEEITPEMIEEMSSVVHEKWLERNDGAKDEELGVSYDQLPEDEKAKDRAQVETAIRIISEEKIKWSK